MDLTALVAHHRRTGAAVTVALARKPNVVEFGNVITGEDGRIERFIEKPSWGQVFSDTVNTGVYVVEPFVLDLIAPDEVVDWSADVFPALLAAGQPMQGFISDAYWEDVGTIDSYLGVQRDVLTGRVQVRIGGFEIAPSVWLGEDVFVDPSATLVAPCFIGAHSHVGQDATIGPGSVLGGNVVVRRGSRVVGSLLDTGVYVDTGCEVQSALIGRSSEIRARVHVDQGAVIGDQCVLREEAHISPRVRVYPARTIEAGAVVTDNVVWEGQGHRSLFGPRGVSGTVNLDITPEMVVRLGSAYASLLPKGSIVTVGRDHSRSARAMNRALAGSLTASGMSVRDLRVMPLPIVRADTARAASAGVYLRTTLGQPDNLDLVILDGTGSDLSVPDQQRLERTLVRGDFRRAFPDEIGDIHTPHRVVDEYASLLDSTIDTTGVAQAEVPLKVVIDTGLGAASLVMPRILSRLGISVLTVNARLDEDNPTSSRSSYHAAMTRLGELVATSRSDLGVRFDPTGERLSLVDETGTSVPARPGAAGDAGPGRGRAADRGGRPAHRDDAGGPVGGRVPRGGRRVDGHVRSGAVPAGAAGEPDLRRRRPGRVHHPGGGGERGRHRRLRPPRGTGRTHPAEALGDRPADPPGADAALLRTDPLGPSWRGHAQHRRGRRQPRRGHHRGRAHRGVRRRVGAGRA